RVGWRHVALDPAARTVRFRRAGVELDPGGIGKGYAIDRMVEILRAAGIGTALLSAGSSSLYALGAPPGEPGWKINVRHPRDESRTAVELVLKDESMSTSGSYEKFFRAGGRLYSHIMDPRTGRPATGMLAVSVVAPRTLDSEAWTKPVFIHGRDWAARHAPKHFRVLLCPDRTRTEPPCAWLQ
ncbi:MAG: FAD:protein FMN transferase, partial [Bryobacteraceae bacterium]